MGKRSSRGQPRDGDSNDIEAGSRAAFARTGRRSTGSVRGGRIAGTRATVGTEPSVQRSPTEGRASAGRDAGGSGMGSVGYDPGPDRQTLDRRHGIEIHQGQTRTLQRLEADFGTERVSRWADEGMRVETMGKPRDMEAFRERQAQRPGEVPTDVERRNEASLQRNAARNRDDGPAGETGVPDVVRSVVSSPGTSLDETTQREMESEVGGDFGDVRIHTGPRAAAAADAIDARAFTVGNHVAFNRGEYRPESPGGRRVLAHELTHVRQQTEGAVSTLQRAGPNLAIDPDPTLEREAERVARTAGRQPRSESGVDFEDAVRPGMAAQENRLPLDADGASGRERDTPGRDAFRGERPDRASSTSPRPRSPIAQRAPQSDTATWTLPAVYPGDDQHESETQGNAVHILRNMHSLFRDVREVLDPDSDAELIATLEDDDLYRHIAREVIPDFSTSNDELLTTEQVGWLETYAEHFARPYAEAKRILRNRASDQLDRISGIRSAQIEETERRLDEKLHELFMQDRSDSTVEKVALAIGKVHEYKSAVDETLEHADKISAIIHNEEISDTISMLQGYSSELEGLIDTVENVVNIADSLDTLFGGSGAHGAHEDIDRFRAGMEAIDAGLGLTKAVPVLGQLWSEYFLPMTLNVLDKLDEVARLADEKYRTWAEFLIKQRQDGGIPQIPPGFEDQFPGGQPILDFMWAVVHDGTPRVTSTVETFFAENASSFSAAASGPSGQDELETSSSTWWPFDEDDEVETDLVSWVRRNQETVWAQLYGNMRWE